MNGLNNIGCTKDYAINWEEFHYYVVGRNLKPYQSFNPGFKRTESVADTVCGT